MYSQESKDETVKAFNNILESELIYLEWVCMKHDDGKFGLINSTDIAKGVFEIMDRDNKECYKFNSAEALVEDGWVVD